MVGAALCGATYAAAQETQNLPASAAAGSGDPQPGTAGKPPKPYGGGSPLEVLMHTKLWEVPPEPKDFVKATRPPESELQYQPTQVYPAQTEVEAPPPKLLNSGQLKSLEGELDKAGARNEKAANGRIKNFAADGDVKLVKAKPHKKERARSQ